MTFIEIDKNDSLHIIEGKKEYFFDLGIITHIKAFHNYVDIFLSSPIAYRTIRLLIGQVAEILQKTIVPHTLLLVDRSTIINLKYVEKIDLTDRKGIVFIRQEDKITKIEVAKKSGNRIKEKMASLYLKDPNNKTSEADMVKQVVETMSRANRQYIFAKQIMNEN